MKILYKHLILLFSLLISISFTSCLEEKEELYDKVGPVATIPVFTVIAKLDPVTREPILDPVTKQPVTTPINAGDVIRLSVRFYSPNIAVRELILNQTVAEGTKQQLASRPITGFDTNNSYVETFEYTVPADAAGKKIVLEAVAVTTSDLSNTRTLTLTIP